VLVLVACGLATACGRDPGAHRVRPLPEPDASPALRGGGPPRSPRIASYRIDATLDPARHTITATQTLRWRNTGGSAVDVLPFHLYLNAFKNESTVFMESSGGVLRGAEATPGRWGWIQLDSVKIASFAEDATATEGTPSPPVGGELASTLRYPGPTGDETVVELPLPRPVPPGGAIELQMAFTAQLPEVFARSGYHGEFHMVAQWFPKIGVRVGPFGAEHWECRPYHAHTEFFADFGTYDVSLTVPSTFVVAATGVLVGATEAPGGTRTFTYRAEDVHDFVWVADPYMEVMSGRALVEDGAVEVRVLYRPEQEAFARRHLAAGIGAIQSFSAQLLPYPWAVMTIVDPPMEAAAGAGGMEYPTLVTTAGDSVFAREGLRLPEYVTVHEVGHNWFGGMLASNEVLEAWLDEGLNDWMDAKVMAELYGPRGNAVDWMGWQADLAALRNAVSTDPGALPSPIATAAFAFADFDAYADASYGKTARAIATLEQIVGPSKLAAAMKAYARTWAFRHPTGSDFFATLARELDQDLTWFSAAFHEVGGIELDVRSAACRPAHPPRGYFGQGSAAKLVTETEAPDTGTYVCEVVITNTGVVHVPVDIELVFEDRSTQRLHWDARGGDHWERFVVERSSPLVEVAIDPDDKLALANPVTHRYRLVPDGSAAMRAGSWFGNVAQMLMQVVGP